MRVEYNGVNIADVVDVVQADYEDVAGGTLDKVTVTSVDPDGLWGKWKPKKDDTLRISHNGIDSGIHYIDDISKGRGRITLKALPVKQSAKSPGTKAWEDITLLQLGAEIAGKLGLSFEVHGAPNPSYKRLDQNNIPDLAFLRDRCALESTAIKVYNGRLILIGEPEIERGSADVTVYISEIDGDYEYRDKTTGLLGGCRIIHRGITGEAAAPVSGPWVIEEAIQVFSPGEAVRFSKGILRRENKLGCTIGFSLRKTGGITACTRVVLADFGMEDGVWITHKAVHCLAQDRTGLLLRRPLEGY